MKLSLGIFLLLFAASGQAKIGSRTLDDPIATTKANVSRPYPTFWTQNDKNGNIMECSPKSGVPLWNHSSMAKPSRCLWLGCTIQWNSCCWLVTGRKPRNLHRQQIRNQQMIVSRLDGIFSPTMIRIRRFAFVSALFVGSLGFLYCVTIPCSCNTIIGRTDESRFVHFLTTSLSSPIKSADQTPPPWTQPKKWTHNHHCRPLWHFQSPKDWRQRQKMVCR